MLKPKSIIVLSLGAALIFTVHCVSLNGIASTRGDIQLSSVVPSFETRFGLTPKKRTYYKVNPEFECISHERSIASWEDSIEITPEGDAYQKGDRCSTEEPRKLDASAITLLGAGNILVYGRGVYDEVNQVSTNDPGLVRQERTEAFCVLNRSSLPVNIEQLQQDLTFHVIQNPNRPGVRVVTGYGDRPGNWKVRDDGKLVISRSITESVLFYHFNHRYSAYISLGANQLRRSALFTAFSTESVYGSGSGNCYLSGIKVPPKQASVILQQ